MTGERSRGCLTRNGSTEQPDPVALDVCFEDGACRQQRTGIDLPEFGDVGDLQ